MMIIPYEKLPDRMKNESVKEYYDVLKKRQASLVFKRIFDFAVSLIAFIILLPVFLILSIIIAIDSSGPVLFKQVRVTQYCREFKIYKFRTMVQNADKLGTSVTTSDDARITKVGHFLRKYRLDEIPQLLNIIKGDMTFVGTRPEVPKYVDLYTDEMMATLLLPAGVTSKATIEYKDEQMLLDSQEDADEVYVTKILPDKLSYNLEALKSFSFFGDIKLMIKTVIAVIK
jgi:lipopolysaccharide/colanic/teichoic acid biosynthesis glycosyltransferase